MLPGRRPELGPAEEQAVLDLTEVIAWGNIIMNLVAEDCRDRSRYHRLRPEFDRTAISALILNGLQP